MRATGEWWRADQNKFQPGLMNMNSLSEFHEGRQTLLHQLVFLAMSAQRAGGCGAHDTLKDDS
jgi:hypothetical protein